MPDLSKNTKLLPHIIPSLIPSGGQTVEIKEVKILPTYPQESLELSFKGTPRTLILDKPNKIARWCSVVGFQTDNWTGQKVHISKQKMYGKEYVAVELPS